MKTTTKEEESPTKKEANSSDGKTSKASSSSTWLRLKDPRIVRVSRALGGKDRHSKVCTIRGLRDRRVRLSVPTAIQLYELQDRLGLNQPSKVVDWLLNAAKHEIDELPPLPIPPMNLALTHQAMLTSSQETGSNSQSNKDGCKINSSNIYWEDQDGLTRPILWSNDSDLLRAKSKQVARDSTVNEKENDQQESNQVPSISLYHRASQSSSSGLISNTLPYGSFFQLDHPSFQSSHFAGSHGFASHADLDIHNQNSVPLPSTLSPSSSSQILVCPPPGAAPQPYFPAHFSSAAADIDPRQMNHFQMFTSTTQNLFPNSLITPTPYSLNQSGRPFHFNIAPRLFNAHIEGSDQPADKDQDFPCK